MPKSSQRPKSSSRSRQRSYLLKIGLTIAFITIAAWALLKTDGDLFKIVESISSQKALEYSKMIEVPLNGVKGASAFTMYYNYHKNENAADKRFKGENVAIVARVSQVVLNDKNKPIVALAVPFSLKGVVTAEGDSAFDKQTLLLKRGQKSLFVCRGAGMIEGNPSLVDCRVHLI